MSRQPESFILGSPGVWLPARLARMLFHFARLDEFQAKVRGRDADLDALLIAIDKTGQMWLRSATGTSSAVEPEPAKDWFTTTEAAQHTGLTDRGIRRAITEQRLEATNVAGRYRISREALAHYTKGLKR